MAAILRASEQNERRVSGPVESSVSENPIARLASLHAEAEETARLANLLGRSIRLAPALPVMAGLALGLGGAGLAQAVAWSVFTLFAAGATVFVYRQAIAQPFERAVLKSFSQDLNAILVFTGFAWGAGAFLVLPADSAIGTAAAFAAGAAAVIALLLRERECAFLFLAPVSMLTSFACVLRPLPGGALDAALVLIGCAAVAGGAILATRMTVRGAVQMDLAGLPFA